MMTNLSNSGRLQIRLHSLKEPIACACGARARHGQGL